MTKYIIRAIKYFIFICALVTIIILLMVAAGFVQGSINEIFRNGYNAIWQIALIFAVIAAIYPKVGFVTRRVSISGTWEEAKDIIHEAMQSRRYKLTSEDGDILTYRLRSIVARIPKFFADEITITRSADTDGAESLTAEDEEAVVKSEKCVVEVEGPTKDVLRMLSAIARIHRQKIGQ